MSLSKTLGFSKSKSKGKTSPWAPQQPYLKDGFGFALDTYNQQQSSPWGQMLGQFGNQMAPGIGQAQDFFGSTLDGSHQAQVDSMRQNYWRPENQMAADALRADTVEGLRRSDWGDALGASISGLGVGQRSDGYLKMRMGSEENAMRGYQQQLAGLHNAAADRQYQAANDWSQRGFQGAGMMGQMGMQGMNLLAMQHQLPWDNLSNYWNIVGGANWGSRTKEKGGQMGGNFGFA
jgi:hypothetical protein